MPPQSPDDPTVSVKRFRPLVLGNPNLSAPLGSFKDDEGKTSDRICNGTNEILRIAVAAYVESGGSVLKRSRGWVRVKPIKTYNCFSLREFLDLGTEAEVLASFVYARGENGSIWDGTRKRDKPAQPDTLYNNIDIGQSLFCLSEDPQFNFLTKAQPVNAPPFAKSACLLPQSPDEPKISVQRFRPIVLGNPTTLTGGTGGAHVHICNGTKGPVSYAVGYSRGKNIPYETNGWHHIENPGECDHWNAWEGDVFMVHARDMGSNPLFEKQYAMCLSFQLRIFVVQRASTRYASTHCRGDLKEFASFDAIPVEKGSTATYTIKQFN